MNRSSTSSSEDRFRTPDWFALRLLLFCSPVLFLLLAGHLTLYRIGEGWSIDEVIDAELQITQHGEDSLFGRMLVAEEMRRYKLMNIIRRRPKVLVLGTSTIMQFRAPMFGGNASEVYNAGGIAQQAEHLSDLMPILKDNGVRSILLGIDFWWFNKQWQTYQLTPLDTLLAGPKSKQDLQARLFALRSFIKTVLQRGHRLKEAVGQRFKGVRPAGYVPIGLEAQLGSGFRGSDGSRRYASFVTRVREGGRYQDGMETLHRIEGRKKQFVRAAKLSERTKDNLRDFITDCREAGIEVAVVLPPLAPETYDALMQSPDHAAFLREFVAEVPKLLRSEHVPHVVATDLRVLGLDERNMIDGLHGSEVAMGHIMLRLLDDPAAFHVFPNADAPALRRDLAATSTSVGEVRLWTPDGGS